MGLLITSVEGGTFDGYNFQGYGENTVEAFNIPNKIDLLERSIGGLMSQENQLYQSIHESTYEGFISKLRQIFSEVPGVKAALRNFKKGNLVTNLDLPDNLSLKGQEISIILDPGTGVDLYDIFKLLKGRSKDFYFDVETRKITLTFEYNAHNVKTLVNELEQRSQRNAFDTTKGSMRLVNKEFNNLMEQGKLGRVWLNKDTHSIELTGKVNTTSNGFRQNFGYKKDTIKEALKDPKAKTDLMMARSQVYNKLLGFCNGIKDLEYAFNKAWIEKMGDPHSDANLEAFLFLSKGGNLNAGVSGAIQELYGAIITEYVALQSTRTNRKVAEILGNILQDTNEQPKTDLQILQTIGVQVKAYSMSNETKRMSTNVHPGALEASLSPLGINNVADTIVQAVFNSTNGDYQELAEKLEPALVQLMNFDTGHQIEDRVCFYLVDAQFLVPGSQIIQTLLGENNKPKISIRASYKTKDDSFFNAETHTGKDGGQSPNFDDFYAGTALKVTTLNENVYDLLLNHSISIDVDFDYSFMGLRKYSVY